MAEFFHSVTLDKDKCKGCINCIKRCPTEAIRVRDGKAHIITERCIDCGECIRVCPHNAKKAIYDYMPVLWKYKYNIALTAPSLYGQFNNLEEPQPLVAALQEVGFDEVFDVGKAAELVSAATRQLLKTGALKRPVISSACPAVVRLIRVRFPELIDNVLPLVAPVELAARMARQEAMKKGYAPEEIGCTFLTPCPAKVTAFKMPIGSQRSDIDAAIAVKEIYPLLVNAMKPSSEEVPLQSGRIGVRWGESGGEAAGLLTDDAYLAADGIENVIRVLEDLEDDKYSHIDFVELDACAGGCVGGVLQVENPYIARAKLKRFSRYMPVSRNQVGDSIPPAMLWDTDLEYAPVLELGQTKQESFEKYEEAEEILEKLPGLDCGSCGAPTCATFAEDVVRGYAVLDECVVLLRERMEAVLKAVGLDDRVGTAPAQTGEQSATEKQEKKHE